MVLGSRVRSEIMRCQSMQISLKHLTGSLVCSAPTNANHKPLIYIWPVLTEPLASGQCGFQQCKLTDDWRPACVGNELWAASSFFESII